MKRVHIYFIICFNLVTLICYSQNSITIDLEDFNSIRVSGRIDVELIPSNSTEMRITSKNNPPEEVKVEIKNGELNIKVSPKFYKGDIFSIKLPYKNIVRIDSYAGAVINSARNLEAEDLDLKVASGGKIELSLVVKNITAKITQVSDIILYGIADSQNVTVNTGGNYLAYELACDTTYIKVSFGSQGKVTASRKIEAIANTKGYIGYIGDPAIVDIKTSLGGEIVSFKNKEDAEL